MGEMNRRNIILYTAGKYTGKTPEEVCVNIHTAKLHAIHLWEEGYTVICPHMNTGNLETMCDIDYEDYMQGDFEIIKRVDGLYMLPGWRESKGAIREQEFAQLIRKPVFYDFGRLNAYFDNELQIKNWR